MKLTEQDIELFKNLSVSGVGKALLDYLGRLEGAILDPVTLSKDNVEARKEAIETIRENITDRIRLANQTVKVVNETE